MSLVQVVPTRWSHRGEAVVEHPTRVPLLVWSGIPGERAEVRVVHEGRNQAFAVFDRSPSPDPHRVTPVCERYTACGGCPLMHLSADGQREARFAIVREALRDEGLGDVELGDWFPSPDGLADFRHVVKVGAGYSDQGRPRVGAWGRRDRRIVPIPNCNVATETLRQVMRALAHHMIELEIRPYDPEADRGILKAAVLRQSRTDGSVLVTLVVSKRIRELQDLADLMASEVNAVVGVWVHVNRETGNAIFARGEDGSIGISPLAGRAWIEEEIDGIGYRIGPGDFFQTNPSVASVVYRRALERAELAQGVPFVDLYAGVGGLALQAARHTGWALGVETVEGAVARARESARRNGLSAEFLAGEVLTVLPDIAKRIAGTSPVVSVDPARRGLEEGVVEAILDLSPRSVIYVSCNPRSLARDLAAFRRAGCAIEPVDLFDMFPNTVHVECLAVIRPPASEVADDHRRAPRRKVVRRRG